MTGEYIGGGTFLYTEKLVGSIVAGMGFVLDKNLKSSFYVPNTVLNKDIRDVTVYPQKRVLAILKKKSSEAIYNELVYLAKGIKSKNIIELSPKIEKIDISLQ